MVIMSTVISFRFTESMATIQTRCRIFLNAKYVIFIAMSRLSAHRCMLLVTELHLFVCDVSHKFLQLVQGLAQAFSC